MRLFFLASDTIDILCYSNLCAKKLLSKVRVRRFSNFKCYFFYGNLNKLSIKYQSYPKSSKIDGFGQQKCINRNPNFHKSFFYLWNDLFGEIKSKNYAFKIVLFYCENIYLFLFPFEASNLIFIKFRLAAAAATLQSLLNPFVPSVLSIVLLTKISILI